MADAFFKVFKHPSDHGKWDKQIEFLTESETIPSQMKKDLVEAYSFLRKELGEDFLKNAWGKNHPVHFYLSNKVIDSLEWTLKLEYTLRFFKATDPKYPSLIDKLKSVTLSSHEGIPFVDISYTFIKQGLEVRVEPNTDSTKKPDMEVFDRENNVRFFIEVSTLNESDERRKISDNYHILFNKLHFSAPCLPFSCFQKKYLDETELKITFEEIQQLNENSNSQESFLTLINDRIELAVAHEKNEAALTQWCNENGQRSLDLEGLPLNFDESSRISRNKIQREAKQIPAGFPGIIYIPISPLYFWVADLNMAIALFEGPLAVTKNILGIVLYSYIGTTAGEISHHESNHFFGRKMVGERTCRDLFFVFNRNCEYEINPQTMDKIYRSFQ